jgi:NADPH:quinone reductase-like Zn-dependent oxidoreductase
MGSMTFMSRLFVAAVLLACGTSVSAHHRFSTTYVEGRDVTIEGEVVRVEYRDPHSFMYVMVQSERNPPERWIVECRGAGQLKKQGVAPDTNKPGQRVIITGSPGRITTDHRLRLRTLFRPEDGWKWRDAVVD